MDWFSFTKQRILKTALKFEYRDAARTVWRLKDEGLVAVAQSILPAINKFNESSLPHNFHLLKGKKGERTVFRVNSSPSNKKSFVVKVCPLTRFRHRLKYTMMKHQMFGFSEVANLIIAAERGLNVPKVYGYGYVYDFFRLIKMSIAIIEDLNHYSRVDELLKLNRGDEQKYAEILNRTIPVFVDLYKAGCNNIEINLHAIMLSDNGSYPDAFVLDFEGAKFHNKPSLEILMFEAASLVKWSPQLLTEEVINNWLAKLFVAIKVDDGNIKRKMIERFNYYRITKLHRKDRIKIH
jgi:hypothetical protein